MKYGVNFTYVERGYAEIEADDKDEAIDLLEMPLPEDVLYGKLPM